MAVSVSIHQIALKGILTISFATVVIVVWIPLELEQFLNCQIYGYCHSFILGLDCDVLSGILGTELPEMPA